MNLRAVRGRLSLAVMAGAVGLLAGCGTTSPSPGPPVHATVTAPGSGPADAANTVVSSTTTAMSTTTYLPGTGRPAILLGDMNTPEQFIIGALYQGALEAQGFTVDLSRNIGATAVSQAAMAQGSLDIYPEYLNVYLEQVAGRTEPLTSLGRAESVARRYARRHGQILLAPTPFSDTAGIAVLSTYARAHRLRTLGDLHRVQSHLILGAPLEYMLDPAGLSRVEQAYDFTPAVTAEITVGGQYTALTVHSLKAAYVQTSDWQLSQRRYRALSDPQHVLGFGNVVPVVARATLNAEGPVFANTINRVDRLLTQSAIRGLAAEMSRSTDPAQSAGAVALEFLQGYGIVPPPPWSTTTTTTTTPTGPTTGVTRGSIGTTTR